MLKVSGLKYKDFELSFFKKELAQSTTSKPLPPPSEPQPTKPDEDLPPAAKKILATLWKYQKQHFRDDYSKRWTFTVQPNAQGYPYFLSGLAETVQRGFVVVSPENFQCMLTNEGIAFIQERPDLQDYDDLYMF